MKILFSPSETKFKGGVNSPIDKNSFIFPECFDYRQEAIDSYKRYIQESTQEQLEKLFGTKKTDVIEYYKDDLFLKGILKVINRYDGVAYDYLKYDSLNELEQNYIDKNLLIFSNLFGPLLAGDVGIPDYKLKQGQKLGSLVLEKFYCEHFSFSIDSFLSTRAKHWVLIIAGRRNDVEYSDALARNKTIQSVPVHHEQSASYAAMAYAQANENIGVCMVSTGCAGTNAITGVLCAWQDDIPCIFISGQHKLEETTHYTNLPIRTYGQQEADIIKIVKPITKYASMITDKNTIGYEIDKALYEATSGRKGPVWIDIPLCVQNSHIDEENLVRFRPIKENISFLKEGLISKFCSAFNKAKRPIVLIGSGVRSSKSIDKMHEFLKQNNLPVVYAASAVDVADPEEVNSIGCVGAMGANRAANFAVQNADMVLVLGCRLTSMTRGDDISKFTRDAKIVAIDIDEHEHKKHESKIDLFIHSDIKEFLNEITKENLNKVNKDWISKCIHWKKIFPKYEEFFKSNDKIDLYHFAKVFSKYLHEDALCVTDSGLQELIVPTTVEFKKTQRAIHPVSQGAMGYALPAAIGAYYATKKQVSVVVGDGSIMMNLQELQTISFNKLPIKIFVINNNAYAVIRKRQKELFRNRTIGTDDSNGISCSDFKKVAYAFDLKYELIEDANSLETKMKDYQGLDEAMICEVMCKEEQNYIHSSYRRSKNGKFVQPPLEDQSPFLDRELFLSEMIINPIDL